MSRANDTTNPSTEPSIRPKLCRKSELLILIRAVNQHALSLKADLRSEMAQCVNASNSFVTDLMTSGQRSSMSLEDLMFWWADYFASRLIHRVLPVLSSSTMRAICICVAMEQLARSHSGMAWQNRPGVSPHRNSGGNRHRTLEDAHRVSVRNVPSYRYRKAVPVNVPGYGTVVGDIAWGGNWFFLVSQHNESLQLSRWKKLSDVT